VVEIYFTTSIRKLLGLSSPNTGMSSLGGSQEGRDFFAASFASLDMMDL
jgi:hypothetical protein